MHRKLRLQHQTHKETILKFSGLIAILFSYFLYMSWKYDAATGVSAAVLTWSFFVLCTPVADGGFILAFPIRLLFGFRMFVTQVVIWFVAVGINVLMLNYAPESYGITFLTGLLKSILTQPYPYWGILILSMIGTLLSVYFGDEMMDVTSHKERHKHHKHGFKYRILATITLGILTVVAYYHLLSKLGISLDEL